MILTVTDIARVAHEINRAYCNAIGDHSQPLWADAPAWQRESARDGVRHKLNNPDATPEQMHENWMKQKVADGWVYGEKKDALAKTHPCLVPYESLPLEQRVKDYLFSAVVETLVRITH